MDRVYQRYAKFFLCYFLNKSMILILFIFVKSITIDNKQLFKEEDGCETVTDYVQLNVVSETTEILIVSVNYTVSH